MDRHGYELDGHVNVAPIAARRAKVVGFYSRVIFPRLCDFGLDRPFLAEHRQQLLANAEGEVLEIGFGSGLNLPYYPKAVRRITIVDPNVGMHRLAQRRINQTQIEIDQRLHSGEQLPFEDNSFDCMISTFTLCSIANVNQAILEGFRVLRPGGRFLFFEHGLSPEASVQKWQRRLNWLQMRLADGCRLDRNIKELVADQPFSAIECREFYLENTPKSHGYVYRGIAIK
jgi:ubiquinone/menaquinone biosynthesis C-methylase UbiE